MDKKLLFLSLLFPVFIVGCATTQSPLSANAAAEPANNTELKLSEAAASISSSLAELAAIENANNPKAKLPPPPNPANIGMASLASVDWSGPVQPIVQRLADASNYKLLVLGQPPAPVIVSVNAANATIADILRDVSYQAGKQTDILIYPSRRIIELRYLR